jgi:hypothetical protein
MARRPAPRLPVRLLAFLALALLAAFPYFERIRSANELPRLMQGIALVEAGELAIDGPATRGIDPGPDIARSPVDERLYPNKPPGATVVAVVAFATGRVAAALVERPFTLRGYTWWARLFGGILPTLVVAAWAFVRHEDVGGRDCAALAVGLWALATPAAAYAHLFYGHALAAALLFVGIALLVDGHEHADPRRAAAGGVLAGSAVTVEYGAVTAGIPLAVLLLSGVRRPGGARVLVAGLAGALVPVLALAGYHMIAFGSPFATGYHHAATPAFADKHGVGLLGLRAPTLEGLYTHVLALDTGLWWWSPIAVFGVWGLIELAARPNARRTEARVHLAAFLLVLVMGTGLSFEGGWRIGPRYLVLALPGLALGLAHEAARVRERPVATATFAALAAYAVAVEALAANLWPHVDPANVHGPVGEVLLPLVAAGRDPWGVAALVGLPGSALLAIGTALAGMGVLGWRWARGSGRTLAAAGVGALLGLAGVGVVAAAVEPHARADRNLAYIESVWEPEPDGAPFSRRLDVPLVAPP